MADKKLFLVDAMALVFRAYYALIRSPRITSTGKNTNAQFGFTNALVDLIQNQKPSHIAVCFDTKAPTERHLDFADYKANRQEAPEDLLSAIPDIKKIIEGFNIPVLESDGYEADDIIGTLSQQAAAAGYEVFMVTPDKDYGQLVTDKIKIYKPGYQGGAVEIMGPAEVCAKWQIQKVEQVVDMLAMMGDSVDNIPGIPGVGEKTAVKLLQEYGSLEQIIANANNIKGSLGEKIRNGKELAVLSKKLATIITTVPVEFHEEDFRLKNRNKEQLMEIFSELEFRTIGKRILGEEIPFNESASVQRDLFGNVVASAAAEKKTASHKEVTEDLSEEETTTHAAALHTIDNTPHQYILIKTEEAIESLIEQLKAAKEICFDTETTGLDPYDCELVGLAFSIEPKQAWYVPCPPEKEATQKILSKFKALFEDDARQWIGQNIKFDLLVLRANHIELKGRFFDTMLAHYVIEPEGKRGMDVLSAKYLHYQPISITSLIGKKGKNQGSMRDIDEETVKEYAGEDADITMQLKQVFFPQLKEKSVEEVFYKVETPLIQVLADMEWEGIGIDVPFLKDYAVSLDAEIKAAEKKVFDTSGFTFNLSSPKQLGEVLFEHLKLDPKAKKTKTGQYATGEDVLQKLAHVSPVVADILSYRELTKLKSTYVDALPLLIQPKTGRVHTNYGQAIAVTGRLSSNNPNLQNIPVRTERGREIRKAFIPRDENHLLLSADYSQIELRIVAAISGDPAMCEAFIQHKDIHTATAAKVYKVAEENVTKEMRYKAKSVNFGIIYGQGAFGLAENLGISRTEAKEIIDNYKKEFTGIQQYMDDTIAFAKQHGYVETLMGRKRWLRDIQSSNFTVRGFAERNAINSPIQGTAADMIKLAMIKTHEALLKHKMKSKMILQVHDELLFDVVKEEADAMKSLVVECMQSAMTLPNGVPVVAEAGLGNNWLEAH
ncbi:MAG: DNA polymerase I [Bacteroidetes bacterium]|nr:DNA polymerase I [Bacteroidota bacterium]